MNNTSTAEIMDKGISCLLEQLGTVETERFISIIIREKFDYTNWRRKYFDNIDPKDFNDAAVSYAKEHPFQAKRELIPVE